MSIFSPASFAILKILVSFLGILISMQLRFGLGISILVGSLVTVSLSDVSLSSWIKTLMAVFMQSEFLLLVSMIILLLLLSGILAKTGQNKRLVDKVQSSITWPKARLVLFPALVGLLPMPGGALFSCPMLDIVTQTVPVSSERKALINYWFRHIWEVACPLYPGYILASSLLGLPLSSICIYSFPMVILFFFTGCFYFLRDIPNSTETNKEPLSDAPLSSVIYEALPLLITVFGAAPIYFVGYLCSLPISGTLAFFLSLFFGILTACYQGRKALTLHSFTLLIYNKSVGKMLLIIFAIYVFKDTLLLSNLLSAMSSFGSSMYALVSLFFILPFLGGAVTGVMVGYVGATFPLLLSILDKAGLQQYTLPLMLLSIFAGNCGEMISPLHICYAVTCDYYKVSIYSTWKKLVAPITTVAIISFLWVSILWITGAHF